MSDEVEVFSRKEKCWIHLGCILSPRSFLRRFPCGPYTAHLLLELSAESKEKQQLALYCALQRGGVILKGYLFAAWIPCMDMHDEKVNLNE
jgi:hypothetical protein